MFAIPLAASFIVGYGLCWLTSPSSTISVANTEVTPAAAAVVSVPRKTFREELAERVQARRMYLDKLDGMTEKFEQAKERKQREIEVLRQELEAKFRNALPAMPESVDNPVQTGPCTGDANRPIPNASSLFRGG